MARVSTDQVFKSLADPTRLALLERLIRDGEQSVVALTARASVSQPAVSKHLAVLKRAGLVRDRRDGRETRYRARPQGLVPVLNWMQHYAAFWGDRFDRLDDLIRRMDP
ncbi:MAG TPA: metalloregulator ArsR/SmtB family transcription factor [Polyangiaceae bacterium]